MIFSGMTAICSLGEARPGVSCPSAHLLRRGSHSCPVMAPGRFLGTGLSRLSFFVLSLYPRGGGQLTCLTRPCEGRQAQAPWGGGLVGELGSFPLVDM